MNPRTLTSAGMETAQETVDRIKEQMKSFEANRASAGAGGTVQSNNPLIDALTARLTEQASGISTSSSSALQASIEEAISGTREAGRLSSEAMQIERAREVGFAQDRASATFTGALESGSGYATQVTALKELTETTEKSIRDLDDRYKQAILANDAATAQRVSDLQIEKLKFLEQKEQQFYNNLFQAANLTQQQLQMQQQSEQFWADQTRQADQFAAQMRQSEYQFEKNLGIQYQELGLREQELDIARERNQIAWAEYQTKKDEIIREKNFTTTQGLVQQRLIQMAQAGALEGLDPLTIASTLRAELEGSGFKFDGSTEDFSTIVMQSYLNVKAAGIGAEAEGTTPTSFSVDPFTGRETTPQYSSGMFGFGKFPGYTQQAPGGFLPPQTSGTTTDFIRFGL